MDFGKWFDAAIKFFGDWNDPLSGLAAALAVLGAGYGFTRWLRRAAIDRRRRQAARAQAAAEAARAQALAEAARAQAAAEAIKEEVERKRARADELRVEKKGDSDEQYLKNLEESACLYAELGDPGGEARALMDAAKLLRSLVVDERVRDDRKSIEHAQKAAGLYEKAGEHAYAASAMEVCAETMQREHVEDLEGAAKLYGAAGNLYYQDLKLGEAHDARMKARELNAILNRRNEGR